MRHLGYLGTGIDAAGATGYDPLFDDEPEIARTLAASVTQHIAFGERAGQQVRRIGSGFGDVGERPARTGPRCASVNGFSLPANTQVPAHIRPGVRWRLRVLRTALLFPSRRSLSKRRGAALRRAPGRSVRGAFVHHPGEAWPQAGGAAVCRRTRSRGDGQKCLLKFLPAPFSLFHGLQIVMWSFQRPTEKPEDPTFLFA